ncbi:MAG: dITP/XTP pyrophosphatase [Candidatus Peregrinibacteria bacterium Greene0416_19]|nr:MAG: dITP/XTP pyrophosphatase [Candidatus Peregrinibacteria bacterium Greene0416_19]
MRYHTRMRLLLGTNNRGKVIEISEALASLPHAIVTPAHVGISESPKETASTFEENAILKAKFYFERAKIPTIADDSGIIVEALNDELGIHTRRWGAGPAASDEEWIAFFLERMKKERNKRAAFVCTIAYVDQDGGAHVFEGRCEGEITNTLEADYLPGLPISACFRPDGYDRVFSALTIDQKNSTSHRGRAVRQLRDHLVSSLPL